MVWIIYFFPFHAYTDGKTVADGDKQKGECNAQVKGQDTKISLFFLATYLFQRFHWDVRKKAFLLWQEKIRKKAANKSFHNVDDVHNAVKYMYIGYLVIDGQALRHCNF